MRPVRVVQVGLGGWGRDWAVHVSPRVPEIEIVAYVDIDATALATLAKRLPDAKGRSFGRLDDALAAGAPEALLITSTLPSHAALVRTAIGYDLHTLVEKPFVRGVAVAEELVVQAARKGVVLMVSQNYRFFPAPRAVERLMRGGSLGELYAIAIDFRRYSPRRASISPHHLDEQPLLVDMSVHHFDLLRFLLGREPDRVSFDVSNPSWTAFSGPSVGIASIEFGDVLVSYRGSWLSAGPITAWAGEWRMEFERGNITWTSRGDNGALADKVVVRERGRRPRIEPLPEMRVDRWGTLTEFALAIREGREPQSSGRDNVGTIRFVEAAVESATSSNTVDVAELDDHRSATALLNRPDRRPTSAAEPTQARTTTEEKRTHDTG